MDSSTVFSNFGAIAEAPGGVQLLRGAILDLAVHGRLVPQDPADEPAVALLPNGAHSTGRTRPPAPFPLPAGWEWACFGDVASTRLGKMLDTARNTGQLRPYLRNANVQWFRFWLDDLYELRLEDKDHEEYVLRVGDLVVCEGGDPGRAAVCDSSVDGMVFQKALHRARPRDGINVWYLAHLLRWYAGNGRLTSYLTGATIKHLTGRSLASLPVPLPPTNEQNRIVTAVDRLMAQCDELEGRQQRCRRTTTAFRGSALHALTEAEGDLPEAWDRVSTHWNDIAAQTQGVDDIRQTILRLAVQGRLVGQDPDDQPADVLLEQLAAMRPRPAPSLSDESRPALPPGWRWASFGEASLNRDSERVPLRKADREVRPGPYDYYGASGVIDHIDDYLFDGELLLIGEDGANLVLRSTPIAFMATGQFWVNNHAHVIDSVDHAALRYLGLVINSVDLRPHLTGIAQPKLNQARMNKIPVPLPPLAEQRRIVSAVDRLMELSGKLERSVAAKTSLHSALGKSISHAMTAPAEAPHTQRYPNP